jgi:uncharacterized protein (TIGR03083 family)
MAPIALADARVALQSVAGQLSALVRSATDPDARAMGVWSVAELATHITQVVDVIPDLATGVMATSPLAEFRELGHYTKGLVEEEAERDLHKLADRIDTNVRQFMEATASMTGNEARPWLVQGLTTDVLTFHCHLLNEMLVHGHDIARASGQRWTIDRAHAALALQGFIVPALEMLDPRTIVNQDKAARLKACYDVRLRGAGNVYLVFDEGTLTPEAPSPRRVHCHISAHPGELLLVMWKRKSQWGPIARFKLTAWGLKPWLAFRLVNLIETP